MGLAYKLLIFIFWTENRNNLPLLPNLWFCRINSNDVYRIFSALMKTLFCCLCVVFPALNQNKTEEFILLITQIQILKDSSAVRRFTVKPQGFAVVIDQPYAQLSAMPFCTSDQAAYLSTLKLSLLARVYISSATARTSDLFPICPFQYSQIKFVRHDRYSC